MYSDIPFWLSLVLMLGGLAVLAWSSDVFVAYTLLMFYQETN